MHAVDALERYKKSHARLTKKLAEREAELANAKETITELTTKIIDATLRCADLVIELKEARKPKPKPKRKPPARKRTPKPKVVIDDTSS